MTERNQPQGVGIDYQIDRTTRKVQMMSNRVENQTIVRTAVIVGVMIVAALAAGPLYRIGARPTAAPNAMQSGGGPVPMPTETDPQAELRHAAEALAADSPELADPSIIPVLAGYLESTDPYVRMMAASAVSIIAMRDAALDSGLRVALRDDLALNAALVQAIGYHPMVEVGHDDAEARAAAVQALALLHRDAPSASIETALSDQYAVESARTARVAIVHALGLHEYTSPATEAVFVDASTDYDADLAAVAARYLDRLLELRGP